MIRVSNNGNVASQKFTKEQRTNKQHIKQQTENNRRLKFERKPWLEGEGFVF